MVFANYQDESDNLSCNYTDLYYSIEFNKDVFAYDEEGGIEKFHFGNKSHGILTVIETFVRRIGAGGKGFSEKWKKGKIEFTRHALAKYYDYMPQFLREYSEKKIYSPHVQAFFDVCIIRRTLRGDEFARDMRVLHSSKKKLWEVFNEIIEEIESEVLSKKFKRKIYAQRYLFKKGLDSSTNYVNALFRKRSRLLVLRVDFSFKSQQPHNSHPVGLQDAQGYFSRFLNNKRSRSTYEDLIGYIWRLEYGELKGYHFHIFFFFDGAKLRKDAHLASTIGEHWKQLTGGLGNYYNCNAHPLKYKRLAIGMISSSDEEKRNTIPTVLAYMHKEEQMLREKLTAKARIWGKGKTPVVNDGPVRGRPRGIS